MSDAGRALLPALELITRWAEEYLPSWEPKSIALSVIAQVQDLRGYSVQTQAVQAVASRAGLAGPRFGGVADVAGQTPARAPLALRMGACS